PAAGEIAHDELDRLRRRAPVAVAESDPDDDLLEPEVARRWRQPVRDVLERRGVDRDGRADGDGDAVPVEAPTRIARAPERPQGVRRLVKQSLEAGDVRRRVARVVGRPAAELGNYEQPLVFGHRPAPSEEAVDVVGARQALEGEGPK